MNLETEQFEQSDLPSDVCGSLERFLQHRKQISYGTSACRSVRVKRLTVEYETEGTGDAPRLPPAA